MKPTPKQVTVTYTVWECLVKEHQHRTEDVAQRCIDHSQRPIRVTNRWDDAKYTKAAKMRQSGMTLRAIGAAFGVGPQRIREALAQWERMQKRRAQWAERDELAP